ncbi:hypothetical protein BOTBODRAFT_493574 [Botryobasidium botryosum FD-172 SS1]|uniref:Uncharacterized protein n=1 Tax=Botryobasidium botryosum (strain FD-172 SS1) TaxID=930990 RepID=A0A067M732_BOTB1|nr:hypothetical protein BOTBODRAFT_493574 [Botryobasidium botryosum FD-172 SS1]
MNPSGQQFYPPFDPRASMQFSHPPWAASPQSGWYPSPNGWYPIPYQQPPYQLPHVQQHLAPTDSAPPTPETSAELKDQPKVHSYWKGRIVAPLTASYIPNTAVQLTSSRSEVVVKPGKKSPNIKGKPQPLPPTPSESSSLIYPFKAVATVHRNEVRA